MSVGLVMQSREFELAMDELARDSKRTDGEIVGFQAIRLARELVNNTRMAEPNRTGGGTFKYKRSGRARAGWSSRPAAQTRADS